MARAGTTFTVRGNLDFKWYPDPVIIADELEHAATQLHTDLDVPLRRSIPEVIADVRGHFDDEGPGWAPWAVKGGQGPAKVYSKTYKPRGTRILRRTYSLFRHTQRLGSYRIVGNNLQYVPIGIKDEIFSSEGGPYTRNVWERPFMGLDPAGIEAVVKVFDTWIIALIRERQSG